MPEQRIDEALCVTCGACVEVCAMRVYEKTDEGVEVDPDASELCVICGHCMAVCPTDAVSVEGLDRDAFAPLEEGAASADAFTRLLQRRRSMREYRDEPVSRETLQAILNDAALAPMGFPPWEIEVTVVPTREDVAAVVPAAMESMKTLRKMLGNWAGKLMLRTAASPKDRLVIEHHIAPMLDPLIDRCDNQGLDCITWGAPALLIFHARPESVATETDAVLAATYAMLSAEARGLGTIMLGIAGQAVRQDQALRARLGVPAENEVLNVLAVGHPARTFRRSITREFRRVNWAGEESE